MKKYMFGALIRSFIISIICLLIFAMIMYIGNVEDKIIGVMIIITYFVSNLIGGIYVGKKAMKNKYIWGITEGVLYFTCIFIVSLIGNTNGVDLNLSVIIAVTISVLGGMIGGMIS